MAYEQIVQVNISLATSGVTRAAFGTPMFITDHVWFTERSRSYNTLTAVAEDVPTDSDAYLGAQQAFSQDIPPTTVKIGRRDPDQVDFVPAAATAIGQVYTITVVGTDSVAVTATFTTVTGSETATDIATALVAGLATVAGVTITDNTGSFSTAKAATDDYSVNTISRLTYTTTTTESAADMMTAIVQEDDDFYFVGCNDHTDAFVMALAEDIEARTKIYFVSLQDTANLAAYSEVATDTMSKLKQNQYFRTSAWYHHEADTTFPEMQYASVIAPYDPGLKIIANNRVSGSAAKNATSLSPLSTTEKTNLVDKNANFTETVGGLVITRRGQVSAGEWVDVIRNRDFLEARISEALQNYLINSPVVPYTNKGISALRNQLKAVLNRYTETDNTNGILTRDKAPEINFPAADEVSFADKAARTYTGSFVAYLSGAIQIVKITGTLTYDAA